MPNRGELVLRSTLSSDEDAGDSAAWTLVLLCAAGWSVSVCVALASASADSIPVLIAQAAFGG
jgi:hypothetical protein